MDNLTNLKALWRTANTEQLPAEEEMLLVIKNFKARRLQKKWTAILLGSLLSGLIVAVTFFGNFKLFSTYAGGLLIAASGLYFVVSNVLSLKRFYQPYAYSNREYLRFVAQTRLNQLNYYKSTQPVMMFLASAGLVLYMYEPASLNLLSTALLFTVTVAGLLYSWLVIRPRIFRKDQEKLEALRSKIENISNQIN